MSPNVGIVDRLIRLSIASVLFVLVSVHIATGVLGIVADILIVVGVLTAAFGVCPSYWPFQVNTCAPRSPRT